MRTVYILIFIFALFSCSNKQNGKQILSQKDFVNLLVDLHLADALATDHAVSIITGDLDSLTIYTSVLDKYNADKSVFDATLKWYSEHPDKFAEVYDEVFGNLNRYNQDITNEQQQFSNRDVKLLYTLPGTLIINGDTAKYPQPFVIPTDTLGMYLFEVNIRMLSADKSDKPHIIAYFFKNKPDTVEKERLKMVDSPILKSGFIREYQFSTKLNDKSYKFLKIKIPQTQNCDTNFMKDIQIADLKVMMFKESLEKEKKEEEKLK